MAAPTALGAHGDRNAVEATRTGPPLVAGWAQSAAGNTMPAAALIVHRSARMRTEKVWHLCRWPHRCRTGGRWRITSILGRVVAIVALRFQRGWDAEPEGSALPPGNGDVVERVPPDLAQIRFAACRVNENCSGASGRESAERSVETDVVSHRANRGDVQHPVERLANRRGLQLTEHPCVTAPRT